MIVSVRGDGVAARCCARLLACAQIRVALEASPRPKVPAIMVGGMTQKLFGDVFGCADLFQGMPAITQRIVAWGAGAEPRAFPHSAVVVDEQELLGRLEATFDAPANDMWTVYASSPLPAEATLRRFGERAARAYPVRLRDSADSAACCVESLESGWLFLIPDGDCRGWLLAVGHLEGAPLAQSRFVATQIVEVGEATAKFPSSPAIAWPICAPGWLACGTSALAFDPLCGDGSGHGIREGILAAAVLRAIARGEPADALVAHYRSRLLAGFARHLEVSREFYRTGGSGPWWREQVAGLRDGLDWCAREWVRESSHYRLRGFDLERITPA